MICLIDMPVENGNYCSHILASINKKFNGRNETDSESNIKDIDRLLRTPVIEQKIKLYINKIACKVEFQSFLCNNKSNFLTMSFTGVYHLGRILYGTISPKPEIVCLSNPPSTNEYYGKTVCIIIYHKPQNLLISTV